MLRRKIYEDLKKWKKESNGSSALLIEGARRVGKTKIAEYFGENEFPKYRTIDFSKESIDVLNCFNDLSDIEKFFEKLFLALRISALPKGSLLIFDEIQFCPKARQVIKSLVADGRYFYLETGSLVSIKENTLDILIPSEEENIQMYPMDYEEFLWACGLDYEAETIFNHFNNQNCQIRYGATYNINYFILNFGNNFYSKYSFEFLQLIIQNIKTEQNFHTKCEMISVFNNTNIQSGPSNFKYSMCSSSVYLILFLNSSSYTSLQMSVGLSFLPSFPSVSLMK